MKKIISGLFIVLTLMVVFAVGCEGDQKTGAGCSYMFLVYNSDGTPIQAYISDRALISNRYSYVYIGNVKREFSNSGFCFEITNLPTKEMIETFREKYSSIMIYDQFEVKEDPLADGKK